MNIQILNTFSRLAISNAIPSRNISLNVPLYLKVTNTLYAEPLKKKKRVDPAVVRAREERKRKKLEKSIRRLEKSARQLKPIAEIDLSLKLRKELEFRKREKPPLTAEELEKDALLMKEWCRYKTQQHRNTVKIIHKYMENQEKSLQKLRSISEDLYLAAIQIDPDLLPYSAKGPTRTPPIDNYDPPDGDYYDITKKYEGET